MKQSAILEIFHSAGALLTESHLVYTSGKHGSSYINKDALYPHPSKISALCRLFAEYFAQDRVDAVLAPALGGIVLTQWTAYHLAQLNNKDVLALYAEKIEGTKDFVIKRGYDQLLAKRNILLLEDIITTGGSIKKVLELVERLGGNVLGLAALCNRSGLCGEEILPGKKFHALITLNLPSWDPQQCPLCKQGVPINTSVGKGGDFLMTSSAGSQKKK